MLAIYETPNYESGILACDLLQYAYYVESIVDLPIVIPHPVAGITILEYVLMIWDEEEIFFYLEIQSRQDCNALVKGFCITFLQLGKG